jgi:hypothetical protein
MIGVFYWAVLWNLCVAMLFISHFTLLMEIAFVDSTSLVYVENYSM